MPVLLHTTSWHVEGQLYLHFISGGQKGECIVRILPSFLLLCLPLSFTKLVVLKFAYEYDSICEMY
jgi:hypothetical protein